MVSSVPGTLHHQLKPQEVAIEPHQPVEVSGRDAGVMHGADHVQSSSNPGLSAEVRSATRSGHVAVDAGVMVLVAPFVAAEHHGLERAGLEALLDPKTQLKVLGGDDVAVEVRCALVRGALFV